jgi:hypothetical protein
MLQPGTAQSSSKLSGASRCRPSGKIFDPRITLQNVNITGAKGAWRDNVFVERF